MDQSHSDLQVKAVEPVVTSEMPVTMTAPRLVVVIREVEEEALLAGRIQEVAQARDLPVLLVGIARDSSTEAELRRSLVTIAAFLREGHAQSGLGLRPARTDRAPEIQIECGRDWLNKIQALLQPDDLLTCYAEQTTGILERPLSDVLSCGLNVPVYTFAGLRTQYRHGHPHLSQAAGWAGSLASIGGFLVVQARIVTTIQGSLQSALLLVTLVAEVGVVWLVNSISGQF